MYGQPRKAVRTFGLKKETMRKFITATLPLIAACMSLLPLCGQTTARLLRFEQPVRDLGRVREVDGRIYLRYEFTNIADKPVTILEVHTQCGCLSPSYSSRPVAAGAKGVVETVFDPANRLGDFSIGLTVISSNGDYKKFNTLVAKGYVINKVPEEEIFYPHVLSRALRSDIKVVGMRLFETGDGPRMRPMKIFNMTDGTLHPQYISGDKHLEIDGPGEIAPRSAAVVEFTLDPRGMRAGEFSIPVYIVAGGDTAAAEVCGKIAEFEFQWSSFAPSAPSIRIR